MAEVKQEEPVEEVEKKPPAAEEEEDDYPKDYKTCTIITMILCSLILNVFSFACLIPAYYYSSQVSFLSRRLVFVQLTRDDTCDLSFWFGLALFSCKLCNILSICEEFCYFFIICMHMSNNMCTYKYTTLEKNVCYSTYCYYLLICITITFLL